MKTKVNHLLIISLFVVAISCIFSRGDIKNENDVIKNMQDTWVGNDHEGGFYTHYKLHISGNNFSGWITTSNTIDEPTWSSQPNETGSFTLSPVQGYTNASGKFRNINFYKEGGGFGNNSLTARSLTNMIIYDEGQGLYVVGWSAMNKK
jgi:hypothetical protein